MPCELYQRRGRRGWSAGRVQNSDHQFGPGLSRISPVEPKVGTGPSLPAAAQNFSTSGNGSQAMLPISTCDLPEKDGRSPPVEVWPGLPPFARRGADRDLGGAAGLANGGDGRMPDFSAGLRRTSSRPEAGGAFRPLAATGHAAARETRRKTRLASSTISTARTASPGSPSSSAASRRRCALRCERSTLSCAVRNCRSRGGRTRLKGRA